MVTNPSFWARAIILLTFLVTTSSCEPFLARENPRGTSGDVASDDLGDWSLVQRGTSSPDGSAVAFLGRDRSYRGRLGLYADGQSRAISPDFWEIVDFAWMPGSRSFLVSYDGGRTDLLGVMNNSGEFLDLIDLDASLQIEGGMAVDDSGEHAVITAREPGRISRLTDLYLVDLATGTTRNLTMSSRTLEKAPVFIGTDRFVFSSGQPSGPSISPHGRIELLDLRKKETVFLSPPEQVAGTAVLDSARGELVYDAIVGQQQPERMLLRVSPEGGEPKEIRAVTGRYPSLSPDGGCLVLTPPGRPGAAGGLLFELLRESDFPCGGTVT